MKKIFILAIFIFCSQKIFSQAPNFIWAKNLSGNQDEHARQMVVDAIGNVYCIGTFESIVDFDPSPAITNFASNGLSDIFLLKLDSSGHLIWVKAIGSTGYDAAISIGFANNSELIISGYFSATVDLDPGPGVSNHTSLGGWDYFVSKFDTSGNFIWTYTVGSAGTENTLDAIILGQSIYVCGIYGGNGFLTKLNQSGTQLWTKSLSGNGGSSIVSIDADADGNLYSFGEFGGTTDFDFGNLAYPLTVPTIAGHLNFILKTDTNGVFKWVKTFGKSDSYQRAYAHKVNNQGDIFVTGFFSDSIDADMGNAVHMLYSNGGQDAYVIRYDSSGAYQWSASYGAANYDMGYSINLDQNNDVYVCGMFLHTVDFDPGIGTYNLSSLAQSNNMYVLKLAYNGNFVWAKAIRSQSTVWPFNIQNDNIGNVYISGYYTGSTDFDPDPNGTYNLSSTGTDAFIEKLGQCNIQAVITNNLGNLTANAATTYQWLRCGDSSFTLIPGATNQIYVPGVSGGYAVVVSINGCIDTSDCFNYTAPNGINIIKEGKYSIVPNPATGLVEISTNDFDIQQINIFNQIGQKLQVLIYESNKRQVTFDVGSIPKGVYFLQLIGTKSEVYNTKLIKE
jgi:hypothetical protein